MQNVVRKVGGGETIYLRNGLEAAVKWRKAFMSLFFENCIVYSN